MTIWWRKYRKRFTRLSIVAKEQQPSRESKKELCSSARKLPELSWNSSLRDNLVLSPRAFEMNEALLVFWTTFPFFPASIAERVA
jgi:hypothetical protein